MLPKQREFREKVERVIARFGCERGEFRYDDERLREELAREGVAVAMPTLYNYVRQYCPGRYIGGRCIPDPDSEKCVQFRIREEVKDKA